MGLPPADDARRVVDRYDPIAVKKEFLRASSWSIWPGAIELKSA
jgi:hypothetical protein